uniref:Nitroreductase family protein n=1 Tax=Dictyoglomus turgidum TaxID=513050 RepID=A0A7C3WNM3_9BACT
MEILRNQDFDKMLMGLIRERRSVRIFSGKKIPREDILSIIEAGIWAPTGCNNQELRFLIIDKDEQLNEILTFKPFLKGASTVVLVFCDMSLPASREIYLRNKWERHLPYIDTGLALENMVLYAKSRGIDSCIVNFSEFHMRHRRENSLIKKIINKILLKLNMHTLLKDNFEFYLRNILKVPKHYRIMCGVALGYAKVYPNVNVEKHGGRKVMREDVHYYLIG